MVWRQAREGLWKRSADRLKVVELGVLQWGWQRRVEKHGVGVEIVGRYGNRVSRVGFWPEIDARMKSIKD